MIVLLIEKLYVRRPSMFLDSLWDLRSLYALAAQRSCNFRDGLVALWNMVYELIYSSPGWKRGL